MNLGRLQILLARRRGDANEFEELIPSRLGGRIRALVLEQGQDLRIVGDLLRRGDDGRRNRRWGPGLGGGGACDSATTEVRTIVAAVRRALACSGLFILSPSERKTNAFVSHHASSRSIGLCWAARGLGVGLRTSGLSRNASGRQSCRNCGGIRDRCGLAPAAY